MSGELEVPQVRNNLRIRKRVRSKSEMNIRLAPCCLGKELGGEWGWGDKEEDHGATKPCALLGQSGDLSRLREHRGPLAAAASTPHLLSREEHASSLTATASQSQQNSNFDGNAFGIRTLDSLLAGLPVSFLGWPAGRDEKREEEVTNRS